MKRAKVFSDIMMLHAILSCDRLSSLMRLLIILYRSLEEQAPGRRRESAHMSDAIVAKRRDAAIEEAQAGHDIQR